jgi:hypothetical protein
MGYDTAGLEWELRERKGFDDLAWGGWPIRSFVRFASGASKYKVHEGGVLAYFGVYDGKQSKGCLV